MADQLAPAGGGLNQIAQQPAQNVAQQQNALVAPTEANIIAQEPAFDMNKEIAKFRQGESLLEERVQRLQEALARRQQQAGPDNTWLNIARGFASPTRTGSFFESLGNAVGEYQKGRELEETRESELMGKQIELQKVRGELHRKRLLERAMDNMMVKSVDAAGNATYAFNPTAVEHIKALTGDPKYAIDLMNQVRQQNVQNAYQKMFVQNKEGKYELDTSQVRNIFALAGPKEASELMKTIPEMRKMGLLGAVGAEGTPFDALAMMASDPLIRQQAVLAADRYKKGLINDEQADKLSKDMIQIMTSHMDRQAALASSAAIASVSQQFANAKFEEQQRINEEKRLKAQQDIKSGYDTAERTIAQVEHLRTHPGLATGLTSALRPTQFVPGTPAYDFNEQLKVLKSQSFLANVQQMRGLGALSNAEGDKVMDSIARINPNMSEKEFKKSLGDVNKIMELAKQRARDLLEGRPVVLPPEPPKKENKPTTGGSKFKVIGTEKAQ